MHTRPITDEHQVRYCNENNIKFLAQSGGGGWSTTLDTTADIVIIDLRSLNFVTVNGETNLVHVGGGANFGEIVSAAYENRVQMGEWTTETVTSSDHTPSWHIDLSTVNGGCNCVGQGALMGGGLSRFSNRYGMALDGLVSANLVTAKGEMITVSNTSHSDLLWAIKGAGANFGIVTSTLQEAYPIIDNGMVWYGVLSYPHSKLEAYIDVINQLNLTEDMVIHWGFNYDTPNAAGTPTITAQVFFWKGNAEAAKQAFKPLYDLSPLSDTTKVMVTTELNSYVDGFCEPGSRKSGYHVGLKSLDYKTFAAIWDQWAEFVHVTKSYYTEVLIECYHTEGIRRAAPASAAAYAQRDINFFAMFIPVWQDPSLDPVAERYGNGIRDLLKSTSGFNPAKL